MDALLDIVGQCTPSRGGKASALSAGCGVVDAQNIRSNCCALISLLVALLATGSDAACGGTYLPDKHAYSSSSCNDVPQLPEAPRGNWDAFVHMNAQPRPDVVAPVQKKGWAERQSLRRAAAVDATGANRSRVSGVYDGANTRRSRQKVDTRGINRDPLHQAPTTSTSSNVSSEGIGRYPGRKAGLISPAIKRGLSRVASITAPFAEGKESGKLARSQKGNAVAARDDPPSGEAGSYGQVDSELPESLQPVSELASPPRLSRVKGEKIPTHLSSTVRSTARRGVVEDAEPLGLSTHGLGKRKRAARVSITWVYGAYTLSAKGSAIG